METGNWTDGKEIVKTTAFGEGLRVTIGHQVWEKLFGWCRGAEQEVSGMAMVKKDGPHYHIYEAYLPKQHGYASRTEIDPSGFSAMMMENHKRKLPHDHFRVWWHTHYNFGTFWSQTDSDNIDNLLTGPQGTNDFLLSLVINQKGEYKTRLDYVDPFRLTVDVPSIEVIYPNNAKQQGFLADVRREVTKKEPVYRQHKGRLEHVRDDISVWCHKELTWVDSREGFLDSAGKVHEPEIINA